jgi:hypothetical protein
VGVQVPPPAPDQIVSPHFEAIDPQRLSARELSYSESQGLTDKVKDADGFELQRLSALEQNIAAGDDNDGGGTIPQSVVDKTKQVTVSFLVNKCYPCK